MRLGGAGVEAGAEGPIHEVDAKLRALRQRLVGHPELTDLLNELEQVTREQRRP